MKQPKRLTRSQKQMASEHRLSPENWMALEDSKEYLVLCHKKTGTVKRIRRT